MWNPAAAHRSHADSPVPLHDESGRDDDSAKLILEYCQQYEVVVSI
jgi:hypothetical protein